MTTKWKITSLILLTMVISFGFFANYFDGVIKSLYGGELFPKYEVFLSNQSSDPVTVKVEPVGMIFNESLEYSIVSPKLAGKPITGGVVTVPGQTDRFPIVNHVFTSTPSLQDGLDKHIGYGKYKVTIGTFYFYVDFSDSKYSSKYGSGGLSSDLFFKFTESGSVFMVDGGGGNDSELTQGEIVEIWDQTRIGGSSRTPNKNGFKILANTSA